MRLPRFLAVFLLCCAGSASADGNADLLEPELRSWVEQKGGVFTVASSHGFRPYSFIGDDGRISGMGGDYLALLSERLDVRFELRAFASFSDMLEAVRRREVDVIPFVAAADERRGYLDFTRPYYRIQDRIVMRDTESGAFDLDALSGKRVGVVAGYVLASALLERSPRFEVVTFPNELTGIRELSVGNIDAFIADLGAVSYYTEQEGITNLRVVGDVTHQDEQSFGVRSDWPELRKILDLGLASIDDDEHAAIARRWISLEGADPGDLSRLLRWLIVLVLVGIVAGFAALLTVWYLRRVVARRTADLEAELAERRRIEAINQRLATALEQSAEFALIINRDAVLEYANRAFLHMRNAADVVGRPLSELVSEKDRTVLATALQDLRLGEIWRGSVHLLSVDSDDVHVSMTITPIESGSEPDRMNSGFVATGRDVGHEQRLEQRLRHSEKISALGTMAGGIAHDFNNLLLPIMGNAELLRLKVGDSGQEMVDAIVSAADRAQHMVQRILSFSYLSDAERVPLDLSREVDEGVSFLRSLLPSTVEIRAELAPGLTVFGDRTQVHQILLNLGTNACDAMANRTGLLTIELATVTLGAEEAALLREIEPGEYCRLAVRDDGVGMSASQQAQMFDPYYTSKEAGKGTGLGLSTVHGIVRAHGGAIRVTSAPGRGTTIEVFLPSSSSSVPAATGARGEITSARGEHVLLVDDDLLVAGTVENMLEGFGYSVTTASDPQHALRLVENSGEEFDLVLTDLTMPKMTGAHLAEEVRARRPGLPVVIMTGNTDLIDRSKYVCIGKPFVASELGQCLTQVLRPQDRAEPASIQ